MSQTIHFTAKLHRPIGDDAGWTFLVLPKEASERLPSRSMVSVEGTMNGVEFHTTLQPDGDGGHWMKVSHPLGASTGVKVGDTVKFDIMPMSEEPEPEVPDDLQEALSSIPKAMETWLSITAVARRDWIHWVVSGKKAETRVKRIGVAVDKLGRGDRRPCCFDRSGMYSKSLNCPIAAEE